MNLKTLSLKEASRTTTKSRTGVNGKFSVHQVHPFHSFFMNVVDYVTIKIGLFSLQTLPAKNDVNAPSSGRNCLNFGLLDFH